MIAQRLLSLLTGALLLVAVAPRPQLAQSRGPGTGGAIRLAEELRFGETSRRVLIIGAHPDDEDNDLLAVLTRGMGMETAYLSLTRGEGGQNLIGNELGLSLGVLRTEELMAARAVDGAQQFFTRAYDFGFSKSAESAFGFWPRDLLVHDVVAVIRRFRPQVIISIWSGTPADGHGQHQASGMVARDAFDAAADPARYPDAGPPWQVAKFYRDVRNARPDSTLLAFDTGALDLAVGQSYHQIAARSRSGHRSQGEGQYQNVGPASTAVRLEARAPGISGRDDSLFAGIRPEPRTANDPHRVAVRLNRAGVVVDAWVDDDEAVRGQVLHGEITIWNTGKDTVLAKGYPASRGGWQHHFENCPVTPPALAPGAVFTCRFTSTVWDNIGPTSPYYLARPMNGAFYQWDWLGSDAGLSFQPPELWANVTVVVNGESLTLEQPVQSRSLSPGLGEVRRPVQIVPRVAVSLSPDRLLWPVNASRQHRFTVSLEHLARDTTHALVKLRVPAGWRVDAAKPVTLAGEGLRMTADFTVTAPLNVLTGNYEIGAMVLVGRDTLDQGIYRINYAHVEPRNIVSRSTATVVIASVALPSPRIIGYIRGAADRVPEALMNSGVKLKVMNGAEAQQAKLDSIRTIVIGPRAYDTDPDLRQAHARLMKWVQNGGTLILQYQQYQFSRGGFAPKPITFTSPADRVTEPDALITLLDPLHPILRTPNRIGQDAFRDWVQERGLYFANTWDPSWKPLISLHDRDDIPREGGLLVTTLGKGRVVYTGLSFFREIPAAVPGAWRLFMNLLAYGNR